MKNITPKVGTIIALVIMTVHIIAFSALAAQQAIKPSFDCLKATSNIEKTICGDHKLAGLDVKLNSIYNKLLSSLPEADKIKLKKEQLFWLKSRDKSCDNLMDVFACVKEAYLQRIETLNKENSVVAAARLTSEITSNIRDISSGLRSLIDETYGPGSSTKITFSELIFSPSSRYLAVSFGGVTSRGYGQVAIIDINSGESILATEPAEKEKIGIGIEEMTWKDEKNLRIILNRIDWKQQNNNRRIVVNATMSGWSIMPEQAVPTKRFANMNTLEASPSGRYEVVFDAGGPSLNDVKNGKVLLKYWRNWESFIWISDDQFIFHENTGHGSLLLRTGRIFPKPETFIIATGSWELEGYAYSSGRLAFAKASWKPENSDNIILYDIKKLSAYAEIPALIPLDERIAWSSDGKLVFSSRTCDANLNAKDVKVLRDSLRDSLLCLVDVSTTTVH